MVKEQAFAFKKDGVKGKKAFFYSNFALDETFLTLAPIYMFGIVRSLLFPNKALGLHKEIGRIVFGATFESNEKFEVSGEYIFVVNILYGITYILYV